MEEPWFLHNDSFWIMTTCFQYVKFLLLIEMMKLVITFLYYNFKYLFNKWNQFHNYTKITIDFFVSFFDGLLVTKRIDCEKNKLICWLLRTSFLINLLVMSIRVTLCLFFKWQLKTFKFQHSSFWQSRIVFQAFSYHKMHLFLKAN